MLTCGALDCFGHFSPHYVLSYTGFVNQTDNMMLLQLGSAAFILFDHSWKHYIPADETGNFDMICGASLADRKMGSTWCCCFGDWPAEYDSDDEYIAPRYGIREPLIYFCVYPTLREKYGLDTSMLIYNSSGPGRYQQAMVAPAEETGRCTIL
ncbi:hypothetical protein OPV22_001798 [Ensete ventricosum]|uniref:Uncharacterized protein n=1 Tax=Ensete ventricosum TaxID=4639 RepID=A0AAV8RVW3_ENSVE|nr:hypothetical protein OPV22_001798 [Ensete ventricosum]